MQHTQAHSASYIIITNHASNIRSRAAVKKFFTLSFILLKTIVTLELDLRPTNAIHTVTDVSAVVAAPTTPAGEGADTTAAPGTPAAAPGFCGVGVHERYGYVTSLGHCLAHT